MCRKITDSIEGMAQGSGLSAEFLSLVLLPLAGNAVEHITAVMVAIKNKMDLALAIAIGSSIQIAIFVLPTCVLFAWGIGNNTFNLQLDPLGAPCCCAAQCCAKELATFFLLQLQHVELCLFAGKGAQSF